MALTYVIAATFYAYWATYNMVIDGFFNYFFLPATLIPSLIIFTEREPLFAVLICQAITLGIIYFLTLAAVISIRDKINSRKN
jgi:hypothetical protein